MTEDVNGTRPPDATGGGPAAQDDAASRVDPAAQRLGAQRDALALENAKLRHLAGAVFGNGYDVDSELRYVGGLAVKNGKVEGEPLYRPSQEVAKAAAAVNGTAEPPPPKADQPANSTPDAAPPSGAATPPEPETPPEQPPAAPTAGGPPVPDAQREAMPSGGAPTGYFADAGLTEREAAATPF